MISRVLVAIVLALAYTSVALAATGSLTVGTTSANQKCLTVVGTKPGNGAQVQLAACSSLTSAAQTWQFVSSTVSGKTVMQLRTLNGLCLDVPDGVGANGKLLQVWTCSKPASTNQSFARDGNVIRWNGSTYCLNINKGVSTNFAEGIKLQLYTCNTASNNQKILGPGATAGLTTSATVKTSTTAKLASTTTTTVRTTSTTSSKTSSSAKQCTRKSTTSSSATSTAAKTTSTTSSRSTSTTSSTSTKTTVSTSSKATTPSSSSKATTSSSSSKATTSSSSTSSKAASTPATSTSSSSTSSRSSTTISTFVPATTTATTALTDIFKPNAKRMLAWGFDDRYASGIGSGVKISSYHHWELGVVTQMPAKNVYIPTYWGATKTSYWQAVTSTWGNDTIPPAIAGFNEPDVTTQANMTPADAAQLYYDAIYVPYGSKGANMISPAVAWDTYHWLPQFMANYTALGGRIDAMGYHIYLGLNNDTDAAVAEVKKRVNYLYKLYGKKIVLSEIGLTSAGGGTDEQIADFINKVGYFLDNSPAILAWALSAVFARGAGWDGYLNSNMSFFWANKTLTPIANQYMTSLYNSTSS